MDNQIIKIIIIVIIVIILAALLIYYLYLSKLKSKTKGGYLYIYELIDALYKLNKNDAETILKYYTKHNLTNNSFYEFMESLDDDELADVYYILDKYNKFYGGDENEKLDLRSIMIVSKYFDSIDDYINLAKTNKDYNIIDNFKYNPISIRNENEKGVFKNIETSHIYEGQSIKPFIKDFMDGKIKTCVIWRQYNDEDQKLLDELGKKCIITYNGHNERNNKIDIICKQFNRCMIGNENFGQWEYCSEKHYTKDISKYEIYNGVISISNGCFANCEKLTEIIIPNSVTKIGNKCFENCYNLKEINIPISVIEIGDGCFDSCSNLKEINIPTSVTKIGDKCFHDCENLSKIEIPTSITKIGNWSFEKCYNLKEINIPASVVEIGNGCFDTCSNLKEINIPTSITKISDECFMNCYNLSEINIPTSVVEIGNKCFADCYNLSKIEIPSSVTKIGYKCFDGCTNLNY